MLSPPWAPGFADQFFRAYLMAFMAWLGVTLGSMAILMLRHLTKGAWGMVIRRILGAAMRCVPLMAVLFIPLLFGIRRLYIWARPLEDIADKHLREHLQEITKTYLTSTDSSFAPSFISPSGGRCLFSSPNGRRSRTIRPCATTVRASRRSVDRG